MAKHQKAKCQKANTQKAKKRRLNIFQANFISSLKPQKNVRLMIFSHSSFHQSGFRLLMQSQNIRHTIK